MSCFLCCKNLNSGRRAIEFRTKKKSERNLHMLFSGIYSFYNKTIMAARNINKGLRKELITFLSWGKEGIIGARRSYRK